MACVTCSGTMQLLHANDAPGQLYWWCPRCGTLKCELPTRDGAEHTAPTLVERCRKFGQELGAVGSNAVRWQQFGIHESIYPEQERGA